MNRTPVLTLIAAATAIALSSSAFAQNATRKPVLTSSATPAAVSPFAPNATISESFDTVAGTPPCPTGWTCTNASAPIGTSNWFQGNPAVFNAQAGATTSYIGANFNNTAGSGTISNWLITPVVQFGAGSQLRFWSRVNTAPVDYADRLEIRASTGGTNTGGTATSTGDFSILLGTINPSLGIATGTCAVPAGAPDAGGYPTEWCEYLLTNTQGIPTTGSGRIAFRYFVTAGGPSGANSNFIGIDTFSFVEGSVGPVSAFTAVTPPGAITLTRALPASTSTSNLVFNVAGAGGALTCTTSSPGYSVAPTPLNLVVGTPGTVVVTHTGTTVGSFPGVVTCTGPAGSTGGPFVYNYTTNVTAAAAPIIPVPAMNTFGAIMLLSGLALFGAFAVRRFS